jgi:hypothetical protein
MQWHWGNIGSFLAGLSTVIIAVAAVIRGPAVIRAWLARQAGEAEAARARAEADREQAEAIRFERRRTLLGWSPGGVETYTVALVTDLAEMDRAAAELVGGGPTAYVVLRVDEGEYGSENRGRDLRMLIALPVPAADHSRTGSAGQGLRGAGRAARVPRVTV